MKFTGFQIKYLFNVLLSALITAVVIITGVYYVVDSEIAYRISDAAEQRVLSATLFSELNKFLLFLVPVLVTAMAGFWFLIIRRIADSEEKLAGFAQNLIEGNYGVATDPDGGEFRTLEVSVKKLKETLNAKTWEQREIANKIVVIANEIMRETGRSQCRKEKVVNLAVRLKDLLEEFEIRMNEYKLKQPK